GPGLAEELWFRGFIGRGLVGRFGIAGGILLTALLFGLAHLEPRSVVSATVYGIFLHLAYLASRSLLVPIFLHLLNNTLSILGMQIPALEGVDTPPEQIPWYVYAVAVLLVAAVAWAFWQSRARLVSRIDGDLPWCPDYPGVELPPRQSGTVV